MTTSPPELPHTLILSRDPDVPRYWDDVELICPYRDAPSAAMYCAVCHPCGCHPRADETDGWGRGEGPCPESTTGEHLYFYGEPCKPLPECWVLDHAKHMHATDWVPLDLGPGVYTVRPWYDDGLRVDLWTWVETGRR